MENVLEIARHLACAICEHSCYIDYIKARDVIENDPSLKELLSEYRKLQFEFALKQNSGLALSEAENEIIQNYFADLQASPAASAFLNCENQLLDLLSSVFDLISKDMPIDLNFY